MVDHIRTPLGEIVPDAAKIDRVMRGGYQGDFCRPEPDEATDKDAAYASVAEMEEADEDIVYARMIFSGVADLQDAPRVQGRLYPTVMGAFDDAVAVWRQKFPNITHQEVAALTKSTDFKDDTAWRIVTAHSITAEDHRALRPQYLLNVDRSMQTYHADLASQQLPVGLLDNPDYLPQLTARGCMVSCYRMIFKAIAGNRLEAPCEQAMTSLSEHGGFTFNEEALFKSLATTLFRQKTGYLVTNRVIRGADFTDIATRATVLRKRIPDVKIYATVGLKNFEPDIPMLHGSVLLDADEDTVRFHNPLARKHRRSPGCNFPNSDNCGADDALDKTEFIERWAAGMHEARLIVARPDPAITD